MNTSTARKPKRKYHIQSEAQIQTKSEVFSDWDGSDKTPVSAPVWKSTQSFAFLPFRIYIFQYILYISYLWKRTYWACRRWFLSWWKTSHKAVLVEQRTFGYITPTANQPQKSCFGNGKSAQTQILAAIKTNPYCDGIGRWLEGLL